MKPRDEARCRVRALCEGDIAFLAERMRSSDKAEVWASHHYTPVEALMRSVEASRDGALVGEADGVAVCAFGVQPPSLLGSVAVPWLLGTTELRIYSKPFLRHSLEWVRELRLQHAQLSNYVDARNAASIRWLRWLGFVIYNPEPWGVEKRLFHRFSMGGQDGGN